MMATVHRRGDRYLFAVKGAPEAVLARFRKVLTEHGEAVLDSEMRSEWHAHVEHLGSSWSAGAGLRHEDGHAV